MHILLGEVLDASNRTEAATTEFEAAVKASPVPPNAHFGLGYLYWKQRRYEEACREFEAEVANQPKHAQALTYLGDAEMHADRKKPAETHLQRALAVDANIRLAHLDLGILLAANKDSNEAVRHFREAIRLDPPSPMRTTASAVYGVPWAANATRRTSSTRSRSWPPRNPRRPSSAFPGGTSPDPPAAACRFFRAARQLIAYAKGKRREMADW